MGASFSQNSQQTIAQTQISQVSQNCTQGGNAIIDGLVITVIDSHIGDIDITNTLQVGKMDCVMTALSQSAAKTDVTNKVNAELNVLPFSFSRSSISVIDSTSIYSYQQSLIDQTCTQTASAVAKEMVLTFIDSSTGNIRVTNQASIESFSCNLAASTYQAVANSVLNDTTAKITESCCGFSCGMCLLPILGLVGLFAVMKIVKPTPQAGAGGGAQSAAMSSAQQTVMLGEEVRKLTSR